MKERLLAAIRELRAPIERNEYDLHRLVMQSLAKKGIPCRHEAALAPGSRVDLLCGRIAVELKRGRVQKAALNRQLEKYAATGAVDGIVVVSEQHVSVPEKIGDVWIKAISLFSLWGIVS